MQNIQIYQSEIAAFDHIYHRSSITFTTGLEQNTVPNFTVVSDRIRTIITLGDVCPPAETSRDWNTLRDLYLVCLRSLKCIVFSEIIEKNIAYLISNLHSLLLINDIATPIIKKDNSCTNMTKLYNFARVVFLALADDTSRQCENNLKTKEKAHFGSINRRIKCLLVVITILRYFSLYSV